MWREERIALARLGAHHWQHATPPNVGRGAGAQATTSVGYEKVGVQLLGHASGFGAKVAPGGEPQIEPVSHMMQHILAGGWPDLGRLPGPMGWWPPYAPRVKSPSLATHAVAPSSLDGAPERTKLHTDCASIAPSFFSCVVRKALDWWSR